MLLLVILAVGAATTVANPPTPIETPTPKAHISWMEKSSPKTDPATRAARRSPKVIIQGIEIPRPVVPQSIPLWRIERAVEIAVQQYADELAARK